MGKQVDAGFHGLIAQLVRKPPDKRGRWFESTQAHYLKR